MGEEMEEYKNFTVYLKKDGPEDREVVYKKSKQTVLLENSSILYHLQHNAAYFLSVCCKDCNLFCDLLLRI